MKKLLFIIPLFLLLICGCTKNPIDNNDNNNENEKVPDSNVPIEEVTIFFDSGYDEWIVEKKVEKGTYGQDMEYIPYRRGYSFLGWGKTIDATEEELYQFDEILYDDLTLYAVWHDDMAIYQYILDDYVPDVIEESLTLPNEQDGLRLMWSTSNEQIMDYTGTLSAPRKDTEMIFYLGVYDNGVVTNYEKVVTVKAIKLKELLDKNLVFGYYSSWNFFGYTEEMLKTLDVVNLSFGYVNHDYTITVSSLLSVMKQVVAARQYGVRVVLSIQGYGSDGTNFSNAASTSEGRKKLAQSMLETVEKYQLDGIDIDWEYPGYGTGRPTSTDKPNYTLMMEEIYKTFKASDPDYIVSAAIPGGPYTVTRFDLAGINNYIDYFHIMTYDLQASSSATHHTALYDGKGVPGGCSVDSSVRYYISHGVTPSKICIGLAFYGKQTNATSLAGSASGGYKACVYSKIATDYLPRIGKGVEYYFDEDTKAPYLIDKVNGLFITYDDPRSIAAKCEYAKQMNIAGVMIWEVGEDNTDTLITAVRKNIKL